MVSTSGTPVVSKANSTPGRRWRRGSPPAGRRRRADQVGGAELAGELEAGRAAVDRDDRRRAAQPRRHDRAEPDRPGPEHRDRRAGGHPEHVEDGARAGLHAAGQRPGDAQVDVLGDLTTLRAATTARVPKEDCPKKWSPTGRPCASVVATEPSGRRQPNFRVAIESQYAERPVRQRRHRPQDGKLRTTVSPGASPRTSLPASRTIPAPSWPSTAGSDSGRESRTSRSVWHMPDGDDLDQHLVGAGARQLAPARGGTGRPARGRRHTWRGAGVVTGWP